jgi:hypothetical protein
MGDAQYRQGQRVSARMRRATSCTYPQIARALPYSPRRVGLQQQLSQRRGFLRVSPYRTVPVSSVAGV